MRNKILLSCLILMFAFTLISQEAPLIVSPSVSPDGSQISFSYQGDIWKMSILGGVARRLTIHESYETNPQWSPNGKQITFQGNRWGNDDIYVMDVEGGKPRRLTYHSTGDTKPKWLNNEEILFSSRRGFLQVERESEVHMVSSLGGTPSRILDAVALSPSPNLEGSTLALVKGNCRIAREVYVGPANRDIWIYNSNDQSFHQSTSYDGQDIMPDIARDQLYFLSARNGRYNIFTKPLNNTSSPDVAEMITDYTDEGITFFDVSNDGSTIVYTHGENLYTFKTVSPKNVRKIKIEVSFDDRFDLIEHETFTNSLSEYELSPDEKQIAFVVRGELFLKLNNKEKKRSVQLTDHPYRDKNPIWINNSTLVFSSDRDGAFNLYSVTSTGSESNLFKTFKLKTKQLTFNDAEEEGVVLSPDKKKIAFRRGRGQLIMVDVDSMGSLSNEIVLLDGWDTPRGIAWSPDSKWIAYSMSDLNFNREIYIHAVAGSKLPVNISMHPRSDNSPRWSADGSKLGFISNRNNSDDDVWFVWLKKSDWEKTQRDWEDEEEDETDDKNSKKKSKKSKKDSIVNITIDFEDIHERLVQVTRLAGNEDNITISKDGVTFYFSTNGGSRQGSSGKSNFMSANWDGDEMKTLFSDLNIYSTKLDKAGKHIYAIKSRGTLIKLNPSTKKKESLSFTAKMDIDHMAERKQVFNEGWRRLRDGFYDPEFHGQDWTRLKSKYLNRCINASTTQDFRRYYNEMLGQLNSSHMGMFGSNPEETQRDRTGLLGIDITPTNNGVKVKRIIYNAPAERLESRLSIGDIITSVNGNEINASTNFYSLLTGLANERTMLNVTDINGIKKEVIIRPTTSLRTNLYKEWVKGRKNLIQKYSNGRLGYIHIQGMNWSSFERFERELTASGHGKEGIVIDVRFNGGGWTTDMLMTVLNVRQHSFTIPRGAAKSLENEKNDFRETYPFGERLPLSSWTKPSIALCNENSYSNAEIFSHAYQALGLGTLVGRPTFGAVISTGSSRLLDGTRIRMPFRAWYVKSTNKNMEHGPAIPDIEVFNAPDSKARGEDPQLQKAVEELLSQIDQK